MEPEHRRDSTVSSAPPLKPLGAYELLNQIAVGEFCTVHRARHAGTHDEVALKRLRSAHQNAYGRARLLREARVGLTLHGPHLARVLEVQDQPEPFLVMEYVPGATLRELLVRSSKIDALPFIAPVMVDVLRGLAVLHGHRDAQGELRPLVHQAPSARHILLGEDGVTRLLDLSGVHRHGLGSNNEVSQRFLRGELAPEQLEPRASVDARCDLFIAGKTLGDALTRAGALRVSRAGEAEVRRQCARLHEVVARACAERPEDRFRSADHMASALQEAAEESELFASPAQLADWLRQGMRGARLPPLAGHVAARVPIVPPPPPAKAPAPSAPVLVASMRPATAAPPVRPPAPAPVRPARTAPVAVAPEQPPAPPPAPVTPASVTSAPVAPAPTPVQAPTPSEPALVMARASAMPAYPHVSGTRARFGSVVGVAGAVALLTSLFTLSVRGLLPTPPTVSAARLTPEQAPAPAPAAAAAADVRALAPTVSPLAAPRKRAATRAAPAVSSPASDFADAPTELSAIEAIAESIRAAHARRENANSSVRPRKLRQELPENPY